MPAPKGNKHAVGHKWAGGAQTKRTPELIETARDYLKNFRKHDHEIPSIVGLATIIGVRRKTLHEWINKAKEEKGQDDELLQEIAEILAAINEVQELTLLNSGLNGAFNPAITKLVLAKHGYHDKQDTNLKGAFSVTIGDKDAGTL